MPRRIFLSLALLIPLLVGVAALRWPAALWLFLIVGPLVALGLHDVIQGKHSLLRVYPVVGHGRFLLEAFRPEIQQYFVESEIDGVPFSRELRSLVYQRAKGDRDTLPFGTQRNVYRAGHEWLAHSLAARSASEHEPRQLIGEAQASQPYHASLLNISAMSYGSLSGNAILSLNLGAKMGGFAHNTGEGGIGPYHLRHGGDLVWQIGTGYFGCRTPDGRFDAARFGKSARGPTVKMIEIKLSQGAKPGHGGILPAAKLTEEIASIRGVPLGKDVISPPAHSAFSSPIELLAFIAELRELSGGKPVGIKLCPGDRREFLGICRAMLKQQTTPDFITVDGAEGGTGAAPLELSNSVGMPLRCGLLFVHNALRGVGLRDRLCVIASAKVVTGFDIFRNIALGANACNSARAMMFALGCIQARRCNDNSCPVGIATQDPGRAVGVHPKHKAPRVARYHAATVTSFRELLAAAGLDSPRDIRPHHLWRRVDTVTVQRFDQIYPNLPVGCLLDAASLPEDWRTDWEASTVDRFGSGGP